MRSINKDMKTYIESVKKEHAAYPEHNILYFENVANITLDSDNVITQ